MTHRDDPVAWTNLKNQRIDDAAGCQTFIDFPHHEIHAGDHYRIKDFVTLGSGGTLNFTVETPTTGNDMHLFWKAKSPQPMELVVYEAGSYTGTVGTALTPRNSNRDYADAFPGTFQTDPTVVSLGTRLEADAWGKADVPARSSGGDARSDDEMKLGVNTVYMYHFLSKGADNLLAYEGSWYDHAPSIT